MVNSNAAASGTCPLCHTVDSTMTGQSLSAGAWWRCTRCSHLWTAERLATAQAYAAYVAERAALLAAR